MEMTTPPCTECIHCREINPDAIHGCYIYCNFENEWIAKEYAFSDLECDMFEQKLDDNETEESSA